MTRCVQRLSPEATKANLEYRDIITENNARYYRYAKAIKEQKTCLACHGQSKDISTEVQNALDKQYPNDIARSYEVGDVRGAVSIRYRLS
jgi:cytochrome c551/c552